ncbi:MAG: hypothetical protein WA777_17635 [Rhodanobacter sp.]
MSALKVDVLKVWDALVRHADKNSTYGISGTIEAHVALTELIESGRRLYAEVINNEEHGGEHYEAGCDICNAVADFGRALDQIVGGAE